MVDSADINTNMQTELLNQPGKLTSESIAANAGARRVLKYQTWRSFMESKTENAD